MDVLITDVTEMSGGNYCVAGWDVAGHRMVRPLPNGNNWTGALLTKHGIAAGVTIQVIPQGVPNGAFPHRTEDTPIDASAIQTTGGVFSTWLGQSAPQIAATLNAGFAGNLKWNSVWNGARQGVYVIPDTDCNSLTAVQVSRTNLSFSESYGKLKASLSDGSDKYLLTVSNRALKEAWRQGGLAAAHGALPTRGTLHARVGLARPYGNPPKCYAMLNGVL